MTTPSAPTPNAPAGEPAVQRLRRYVEWLDSPKNLGATFPSGEVFRPDNARAIYAALLAARREVERMQSALTRIRDEDSQANHDATYPGCHCAYCLARAALAATPEER